MRFEWEDRRLEEKLAIRTTVGDGFLGEGRLSITVERVASFGFGEGPPVFCMQSEKRLKDRHRHNDPPYCRSYARHAYREIES